MSGKAEESTQETISGNNVSDNLPVQNPALKVTTETLPTKIEHSDKSGSVIKVDTGD